jgi:predicted DNA-binding transcriptional regulator AlpA
LKKIRCVSNYRHRLIVALVINRQERNVIQAAELPEDRVLSKQEVARRLGCSERNVDRLITAGEGPPLIQISPRRVGVLTSDFDAWLAARRRPQVERAA